MLVRERNGIVEKIHVERVEGEPNDCCVRITKNGRIMWTDFKNNIGSEKPSFKHSLAVCQEYVHIAMPMSSMNIEWLRGVEWEIVRANGEVLESGGLL